jgi:septal ring-binding cell division protein DamX
MSDVKTLENNVKQSFSNTKTDVTELKNQMKQVSEAIKQINANIAKLGENQKVLMTKITDAAKIPFPEPVKTETVVEKSIIVTPAKAQKAPAKEFIASSASYKLHDPVCPFAKNIKPMNKVVFKTKAKALNLGYKLCDCMKKG